MALNPFPLIRKIDSLLHLEAKHGESIRTLNAEMAALRDRVLRLETREEVVMARAEAAAGAAASVTMGELSRRLGALEERHASGARSPRKLSGKE